MAVGSIAKKMLGYADEFIEGASKGIGDAGRIKNSVNKISSNMTKSQKKKLVKFGQSAGDSAKQVARSQAYTKGTRANLVNKISSAGANNTAEGKRVLNMKGMPMDPSRKKHLTTLGKSDRVAGIQNATLANKAGDFFAGGTRDTLAGMKNGKNFTQALTAAHTDASGKVRYDRVAGSFMAASAAARVATGGGLYKDRNGSTNIIGVPFI